MRYFHISIFLTLFSTTSCFASVIHDCEAETTIHEVISQPTQKNSGKVVILMNDSIRNCLCNKLHSHEIKHISVDIELDQKIRINKLFSQNKIEVFSHCGSSMGSDGKAISFNLWYLKNVLN